MKNTALAGSLNLLIFQPRNAFKKDALGEISNKPSAFISSFNENKIADSKPDRICFVVEPKTGVCF